MAAWLPDYTIDVVNPVDKTTQDRDGAVRRKNPEKSAGIDVDCRVTLPN